MQVNWGEGREIFNSVNDIFYYGCIIFITVDLVYICVKYSYDYVMINISKVNFNYIYVKFFFNYVTI